MDTALRSSLATVLLRPQLPSAILTRSLSTRHITTAATASRTAMDRHVPVNPGENPGFIHDCSGESIYEPVYREEQKKEIDGSQAYITKKSAATAAGVAKSRQRCKNNIVIEAENTQPIATTTTTTTTAKPPPEPLVNSDYLPLPFKGRLGFACLNTYLRSLNPSIFCSRTTKLSTLLNKQKHPTTSSAQAYLKSLGLANVKDLLKMVKWNQRFGIRFMRISSELFPFAEHEAFGYGLGFAGPCLEEVGAFAMENGMRLTMHPGQYTQLASPRPSVIQASIRTLEYHSQLLRLLNLKGQSNRDAVMILHLGGTYGDKPETLRRFAKNYNELLSEDIKARLVLENDDVCWTTHDLLPLCQSLNIPLVLDWHHHNLNHSPTLRPGTLDLLPFTAEISKTWTRKNITQKQHYSEPSSLDSLASRRRHSDRVLMLPPCSDDMDLMIEAKGKEQAVLQVYRKFGFVEGEGVGEVKPPEGEVAGEEEEEEEEEVGMGGSQRRVFYPEGKVEWLKPRKRAGKRKCKPTEDNNNDDGKTTAPLVKKKKTGRKSINVDVNSDNHGRRRSRRNRET